jgi:hypothetical protein
VKLSVKGLALSLGILWGVGIFVLTWWIILIGGATGEPTFIGRVYIGYRINTLGSIIGLLWGFVDGFICGGILAWLYNLFVKEG